MQEVSIKIFLKTSICGLCHRLLTSTWPIGIKYCFQACNKEHIVPKGVWCGAVNQDSFRFKSITSSNAA